MTCLAKSICRHGQTPSDGRTGLYDAIIIEQTNPQFLGGQSFIVDFLSPGDGMNSVVDLPGVHADE